MSEIKYVGKDKNVEYVGPKAGVLNPPDMPVDRRNAIQSSTTNETSFNDQHVKGEMPAMPEFSPGRSTVRGAYKSIFG